MVKPDRLINELAIKYAENNSELIPSLIVQAYKDGYKQGIRDSAHIIKIAGVEYFDLNLPSGTLWSYPLQYENYGWHLRLASFEDVKELGLPTIEQWKELCQHCIIKGLKLITPNGVHFGYPTCLNSSSNKYTTYSLGENCEPGHNRFWLKSIPNDEHLVDVIEFDKGVNSLEKHFTGYKLPFFLVKEDL